MANPQEIPEKVPPAPEMQKTLGFRVWGFLGFLPGFRKPREERQMCLNRTPPETQTVLAATSRGAPQKLQGLGMV